VDIAPDVVGNRAPDRHHQPAESGRPPPLDARAPGRTRLLHRWGPLVHHLGAQRWACPSTRSTPLLRWWRS